MPWHISQPLASLSRLPVLPACLLSVPVPLICSFGVPVIVVLKGKRRRVLRRYEAFAVVSFERKNRTGVYLLWFNSNIVIVWVETGEHLRNLEPFQLFIFSA